MSTKTENKSSRSATILYRPLEDRWVASMLGGARVFQRWTGEWPGD